MRGAGAGFTDEDYIAVGAKIAATASDIFKQSDMVVKVKEPQAAERKQLRKGQILFTYLHLAPDRPQTQDLLDSGVTAIAYETVTDPRGGLPLLAPMSEVAGKLAPQVGSWSLQKANGGSGILAGREFRGLALVMLSLLAVVMLARKRGGSPREWVRGSPFWIDRWTVYAIWTMCLAGFLRPVMPRPRTCCGWLPKRI